MTTLDHARDLIELTRHGDGSASLRIRPPGDKADALLVRCCEAYVAEALVPGAVRTVAALLLAPARLHAEGLLNLEAECELTSTTPTHSSPSGSATSSPAPSSTSGV